MKTHVVKTMPDASLAEAVDLMDIYQVNSMPVVDAEGQLCGFIAEQDILKTIYPALPGMSGVGLNQQTFNAGDLLREAARFPVADVMQQAVVSVPEDMDIVNTSSLFFVNDFTRIPVTSDDGRVVGTLNRIDVVQALFEGQLQGREP